MNGLQMKYFVLNPTKDDDYGQASRIALRAYARAIKEENPELSNGLKSWVDTIELSNGLKPWVDTIAVEIIQRRRPSVKRKIQNDNT